MINLLKELKESRDEILDKGYKVSESLYRLDENNLSYTLNVLPLYNFVLKQEATLRNGITIPLYEFHFNNRGVIKVLNGREIAERKKQYEAEQ